MLIIVSLAFTQFDLLGDNHVSGEHAVSIVTVQIYLDGIITQKTTIQILLLLYIPAQYFIYIQNKDEHFEMICLALYSVYFVLKNINIAHKNYVYTKHNYDLFSQYFCRLKIENEDYKTTFILTKVQRADTGVYTVTAKNSSGTDQVEVEISVLSMFNKLI